MTRLCIFTEGGSLRGYGHVTRCSALYDEALGCGLEPRFVVNGDEEVLRVLGERRVELADWRHEACIRAQLTPNSFAVVDSYLADREVFDWISGTCRRAVYIDDNQRLPYPPGIVVNPSLYGHMLEYPKTLGVSYLLGPQYVILRPEFRHLPPREVRTSAKRVLVTLGGADVLNLTPVILRVLNEKFPELEKHVVVGPGFTNLAEIETDVNERVVLHHRPDAARMRDLMLACDLAVTAAGQTIHELLATGIPFVALEVVDNQAGNFKALKALQSGVVALSMAEFSEKTLTEGVGRLVETFDQKPPVIVDGFGVQRIIESLLISPEFWNTGRCSSEQSIHFSEASIQDAELLLRWRNDELSRLSSINQGVINLDEHLAWLTKSLTDTSRKILIAFLGKVPVGTMRMDAFQNDTELSWTVAPEARGKGIGKRMLQQALSLTGGRIVARIREENLASQKIALSSGFSKIQVENGIGLWEKQVGD